MTWGIMPGRNSKMSISSLEGSSGGRTGRKKRRK